jgi:hypothetical protein
MNEEKFRSIYEKAKYGKLPENITELFTRAREPLDNLINKFFLAYSRGEGLDFKESKNEAGKLGVIIGMTSRILFYIGVEHASEILGYGQSQISSDGESVQLNLDYEEWCIAVACLEATRQIILRKPRIAKQALSRTEEDVIKRIEDLRDTVRKFGEHATEHLPTHELDSKFETYTTLNKLISMVVGNVEEALFDYYVEGWTAALDKKLGNLDQQDD